jgi:predicted DNA-binding transcriptional regulator AlpA
MLLRFPDLAQYGITNHPTLKRWIKTRGAPPGRWLGANTRVWEKAEWDEWLANRPASKPRKASREALTPPNPA